MLLGVHLLCAAAWIGGVLSLLLLALLHRAPADSAGLAAIRSAMMTIDYGLIVPAALGSLGTGLLFCWKTKWGLTRFYWVMGKWTATSLMILIGVLWLGPWVDSTAMIARFRGTEALADPSYVAQAWGVLVLSAAQLLVLVGLIALSTFKPWGQRERARRRGSENRTSA